jgi:hypothetical protein
MVLEVGPDAAQVFDDGDVEPLENIARPYTAELEDLGGVDPARGQDDFLVGGNGELLGGVASAVHLDALGRRLADLDLADVAVDEEVQVGPMLYRVVVRLARRTPCLVLPVGAQRPPRGTEKIAIHGAIVTKRKAQVLGPCVVDMVCYSVSKEDDRWLYQHPQTSGHVQGGRVPCAGPWP